MYVRASLRSVRLAHIFRPWWLMKDAACELRLQGHPIYFKSLRLPKLAHPTFKCFANSTETFGFCQMLNVISLCSLIYILHKKKLNSIILLLSKPNDSDVYILLFCSFPQIISCFPFQYLSILLLCLDVDLNHSGPIMHLAAWINVDWFILTIIITVWSVWRYWNSRVDVKR